jgi:hypothetical protein
MTTTTAPYCPGLDLFQTLWQTRPARHARMAGPGNSAKYYTVHSALADTQLHEHLLGIETYAAPLIGADGTAKALVIEQDDGQMAGARAALDAAARDNLTAFSLVVKGSGGHDGSHTWMLYDDSYEPARLQAQSIALLNDAGLPLKEIYPSGKHIRLPFGVHRRSGTRGILLLQSGETFALDHLVERIIGIWRTGALPLNTTPPPPAIQTIGGTYAAPPSCNPNGDLLPGTDFNARCRQSEVVKMLVACGWVVVRQTGTVIYLRRPGKRQGGHSATLGYLSPGNILCVFSTEDADLPHNRPGICTAYTPWAVFTYLYHNGDFERSARHLYTRGYGTPYLRRKP